MYSNALLISVLLSSSLCSNSTRATNELHFKRIRGISREKVFREQKKITLRYNERYFISKVSKAKLIKALQNAPRDPDEFERILKVKRRQKEVDSEAEAETSVEDSVIIANNKQNSEVNQANVLKDNDDDVTVTATQEPEQTAIAADVDIRELLIPLGLAEKGPIME